MIHVNTYERWWIGLSVAMLIVFAIAIAISGFALGIKVPSPEARLDPNTVAKTGNFANPGLRQLAPGKYEAYVRAESNPWKFRPDVMNVPVNSTVTFYVTSADVQHGFKIEGTNANLQVLPGQVSKVTITFANKGQFHFICDEYCGVGHQNMFGTITVE